MAQIRLPKGTPAERTWYLMGVRALDAVGAGGQGMTSIPQARGRIPRSQAAVRPEPEASPRKSGGAPDCAGVLRGQRKASGKGIGCFQCLC